MNERLGVVSDRYVILACNTCGGKSSISITLSGVQISAEFLDDDALRALVDAANCKLQTGSFAALADTSAVPFVGKRMRRRGREPQVVHVLAVDHSQPCPVVVTHPSDGMWEGVAEEFLLPLVEQPKPKYRPYTPAEAAAHLGRAFVRPGGHESESLLVVVRSGVATDRRNGETIRFEDFAKCTWADGNSPCGIPEPTPYR